MIIPWVVWGVISAAIPGEPPEAQTSLATESDDVAWLAPGLRVALGYDFDALFGVGGTPSGGVHSVLLRVGARLDDRWSLLSTLRYGVRFGESSAMRYSTTVEPTLDLLEHLTLSLGLGLGGFVVPDTGEPTPDPVGLLNTLTLPDSDPLLGRCIGAGVIALIRLEYTFVVGPSSAMGPSLHADAQWTGCSESLGRTNVDTGEAIKLRQYWEHYSAGVGWIFWWR
ncbi:MAG: hypothetical protein IT384_14480 [Deltaproteobacteria bacterium]|nr:hypothetical protein [Deltaproteobacteria bacterium]